MLIEGMLTKQELVVMDLLWRADQPLSLHEILEINPNLNRNTLQSVIRRLMQMNMVQVAGYGFNRTSLTRKITYVKSQYEYFKDSYVPDTQKQLTLQCLKTNDDPGFLKECQEIIERRLAHQGS
ncbi:MAG: BlaI/MecI/CopY family transcriptional regulator [Ileibacterium sp.]|nr:BlaI/MecI/CopY family transcriptional regulator [Ileibacterium sp.]